MKHSIKQKHIFDKIDYTINPLERGEYEHLIFNSCDFANTDLSEIFFLDCEFVDCNLSMVNLAKTTFRDVAFKGCKMLGLQFNACNHFGFSISIEGGILNYASFYQTKLRKTVIKDAILHEVDFTGCDLSEARLDNCDFLNATFDNAVLEKADFSTSFNYSIDPERNRIKQAKFSVPGVLGLLNKYNIEINL